MRTVIGGLDRGIGQQESRVPKVRSNLGLSDRIPLGFGRLDLAHVGPAYAGFTGNWAQPNPQNAQ